MTGGLQNALAKIGISGPYDASADMVRRVIEGYIAKKTIDGETFTEYLRVCAPPPAILLQAFREFAAQSTQLSARVLDIIQEAIHYLQGIVAETAEEREQIRQHILELVKAARKEAESQREFNWRLIRAAVLYVGGASLVVVAGAYAIKNPSAGKSMFASAKQMFRRAAGKRI